MKKINKNLMVAGLWCASVILTVMLLFIIYAIVFEYHYEKEIFIHEVDHVIWLAFLASLPIALFIGLIFFILFTMHKLIVSPNKQEKIYEEEPKELEEESSSGTTSSTSYKQTTETSSNETTYKN